MESMISLKKNLRSSSAGRCSCVRSGRCMIYDTWLRYRSSRSHSWLVCGRSSCSQQFKMGAKILLTISYIAAWSNFSKYQPKSIIPGFLNISENLICKRIIMYWNSNKILLEIQQKSGYVALWHQINLRSVDGNNFAFGLLKFCVWYSQIFYLLNESDVVFEAAHWTGF